MSDLKLNTPFVFKLGPFLDSTDGNTPEVSLSIPNTSTFISKHGGAFSAKNNNQSAVHDVNGWYSIYLGTSDISLTGMLDVAVHVTGALPVFKSFNVLSVTGYNNKYSMDYPKVNSVEVTGSIPNLTQFNSAIATLTGNINSLDTVIDTGFAAVTGSLISVTGIINATLSDLSDTDLDIGSTVTVRKAFRGLFNRFFRKVTQTSTTQTVYNDSAVSISEMATTQTSTTQTREGSE